MTFYFADTSAVAKRYIAEIGSTWVQAWITPTAGNVVAISELTIVEISSVLSRRFREGTIASHELSTLYAEFLRHVNDEYLLTGLEMGVLDAAHRLLFKHPLRTLDAIQLASGLAASQLLSHPVLFVSADYNLLKIAAAEGLTIENPLDHQ